ncbi:MAG: NAD-dependent epimerase/dehydratase family protein [Rhodobacteraceae bacterium]|jgi:nucleoside-diphosphate-sugar epimerase|nr:NAD-dependent epimerase/dehydratase family protein [Paracoccaceae bacterium]
MRIVVTGAAGFLGRLVVQALDAAGTVEVDGARHAVSSILALDLAAEPLAALVATGRRIHPLPGTLSDAAVLDRIAADAPDLVVHLAAVVSGQAEADWDLGLSVNLGGTVALIEACRRMARPPVFVFASSVAVFSCAANETLTEDTLPAPRSSYGSQKLMGELLVRDATRRGFMRGRSVRLPTISVRPGAPNRAASSFASGILREPMAGLDATLPVDRDLRLHLASPDRALAHLLRAAALDQTVLGAETTLTLPGISVTVGTMIEALGQIVGPEAVARIKPAPDPAIAAIVASWPGEILCPRARALGFEPNTGIAELIVEHQRRMATAA